MRMTILRAVKALEMDVDLEHSTGIGNAEVDEEGNMTIYGTESNGELYYVVLDKEAVSSVVALGRIHGNSR